MTKHTPATTGGNGLRTLEFQGHPIRVVDPEDGRGRFVPLNDVAEAVGRGREAVRKMVDRDTVLRAHSTTYVTSAVDGKQRVVLCLDRPGVLLLAAKLNPERSSSAKTRQMLIAFQEWVSTILDAAMTGAAASLPTSTRACLDNMTAQQLIQLLNAISRTTTNKLDAQRAANKVLPQLIPAPRVQEVVTPTLGLTQPMHFELRQVEG